MFNIYQGNVFSLLYKLRTVGYSMFHAIVKNDKLKATKTSE